MFRVAPRTRWQPRQEREILEEDTDGADHDSQSGRSIQEKYPGEVQNMGLNKLSGRAGAAPTRGGGGGESLVGRILLVILACSAALLVTGCLGASEGAQEEEEEEEEEEAEASSERPNIIFVLTDDLDYASAQKMPQITSLLADQGTSFEEAFVSH